MSKLARDCAPAQTAYSLWVTVVVRLISSTLASKTSASFEMIENRRSGRQVPFVLFTDPEVSHLILRENEAKAHGIQYGLAKLPMLASLRTRTLGETQGFAKTLIAKGETISGFTAVGGRAGELLPGVHLAMKKHSPYTEIDGLVITHPNLSYEMVSLFRSCLLKRYDEDLKQAVHRPGAPPPTLARTMVPSRK